uniref:Exportin-T n=1 Tax=Plectus sambesii TaxID=2011161 RepID=A0A914WNV0_9BILA
MQGDISSSVLTDPTQQARVYEYLERLKQDPNGWRNCVQGIVDGSALEAHNQFLFLQVIESYLRSQYQSTSTEGEQQMMRALMSNWLERVQSGHVSAEPVYLKNKMALIFSLVYVVDFPSRWPGFFKEVFLNN